MVAEAVGTVEAGKTVVGASRGAFVTGILHAIGTNGTISGAMIEYLSVTNNSIGMRATIVLDLNEMNGLIEVNVSVSATIVEIMIWVSSGLLVLELVVGPEMLEELAPGTAIEAAETLTEVKAKGNAAA